MRLILATRGSESFEEADGARLRSKAKRVSVNEVDADRIGTAGERGTHRVFENEPGKKQLPDGVAADFVAVSCTKPDARHPRLLSQALVDRSLVLTGLDECLSAACARIRAIEPTDGRWVAGRWVSHRGKEAVATASTLRALIDAERVRGVADSTVWLAAAGGAHPTVGEPSAAAVALTSHLKESAGPLAQLGAASPLLRTIGWTAASLADAGVDGGECCGAIVHDHALRWTLLGDACDV